MKLCGLGGIVPWIGFRLAVVPAEVALDAGITRAKQVDILRDEVWVEALEVEWFGFGVTLAIRSANWED